MSNDIVIATLPVNPYSQNMQNQQNSPIFQAGDNQTNKNDVLKIVDYTDKTFIVFGEATKTYKQQMKDLGGKYNGYLKERPGFPGGAGWIFVLKLKPQVYDFVNKVNKHEIKHHDGVTHQDTFDNGGDGAEKLTLPTVIAPIADAKYQSVHWKVFKPANGMKVTIKAGGVAVVGEVLQTESHRNFVDTAYINLSGNTSKLVICNGAWTVWGYMVDHTVMFSDNTVVEKSPPKKYDYQDIANI